MASSLLQNRPQYEQLCKDYLNLKIMAGNCSAREPEVIQKFKNYLKSEVNSVRKLERAYCLEDVLGLLERRNLLSMLKIKLLIQLEGYLQDIDYSKLLGKYRISLEENFTILRRFYLEDLRHRDRRTLLEKEIEQAKLDIPSQAESLSYETPKVTNDPRPPSSHDAGDRFSQHRQAIFTLLNKEIGRNWHTFGRLMQLSDSSLEEIEFRHPRNVKAIVGDILESAEREQSENGQNNFVGVLLEALVEFRRKDLKNKIEKLVK
nr:fas-associated death domain protein [Aedes albopictus]